MRIDGYGRIDRAMPVSFRFDGTRQHGFAGDTVASAMIAAGHRLMARSFKYHRPRGPVTAGSDEPNALVTIGRGAAQFPNERATVQEIFDGLEVRSQNAWPSLRRDALAVNDLLSPFLAAGFYYKTFMWPPKLWEAFYEPLIRRAAGLGALSGRASDDCSETAFAFCDLLVIGAGPAGLVAALSAARGGADVILIDEQTDPGGRLLSEREEVDGRSGADWAGGVAAELLGLGVRIMTRTTVTGAYDGGVYAALERVSRHRMEDGGAPLDAFWRIVARRAVLAAGAHERHVAFPGNDRPGIMTASAVRSYLHRWGAVAGRRVAVFGNNDDAHRTVRDLVAAGVEVVALIDSRPGIGATGDVPAFAGGRVMATRGRHGLRELSLRHDGGKSRISCEVLAVSGGWNPAVHLACHMGARPHWRADIAAFVPSESAASVPGLVVAGAAAGRFSTAACLEDGLNAARQALAALGLDAAEIALPRAEDGSYAIAPLWWVEGKGRAWLDFQNDVTVKDVRIAAAENFRSVEHMKRYTTQGMATDQGKGSNVLALAVLADATGRGIAETGTTTFRPPYVPVPIAAMGAGSRGVGFAPCRHTASHRASAERGAPMIEAGHWYRPSFFPRVGEADWRHSCDREVGMVRQAVGVCDVSTLGKIDVQGPDAATFLDLVYANTMSTLAHGRVRYGLMLREDGHVMDDGTIARLGSEHYLLTTTTAAAAEVARHLDFVHQCLVPEMDLILTPVTEHWTQIAVAGPRSRVLVNLVVDAPIDDETWPYMSCGGIGICGVAGRLFRISFSGEHAYELAVPACYGDSLFRLLVGQAESLGGGAYGMEALNVLRIEKGHLTHAEISGRTTAFDLGLGRMLAPGKDFIGKAMAARPGLSGPEREQLVGLVPEDAAGQVVAGASLFASGVAWVAENAQGYVTSACHSPIRGTMLGLGLLRDGRARHGEMVVLTDRLRAIETRCIVGSPVSVDPEGRRLRG